MDCRLLVKPFSQKWADDEDEDNDMKDDPKEDPKDDPQDRHKDDRKYAHEDHHENNTMTITKTTTNTIFLPITFLFFSLQINGFGLFTEQAPRLLQSIRHNVHPSVCLFVVHPQPLPRGMSKA